MNPEYEYLIAMTAGRSEEVMARFERYYEAGIPHTEWEKRLEQDLDHEDTTARINGVNGVRFIGSGDPKDAEWVEWIEALIDHDKIALEDENAALRSEWIKGLSCPHCGSSAFFIRRDKVQEFDQGTIRWWCSGRCGLAVKDTLGILYRLDEDPAFIEAVYGEAWNMNLWPFKNHWTVLFGRVSEKEAVERARKRHGGNPFLDAGFTISDLANLPEPEPLILDTLDRRTEILLVGQPGTGKSFLALDWSACIASGTPWQGREVRKGRVLYIAAEGVHGIAQRLAAWQEHHGVTIPDGDLIVSRASDLGKHGRETRTLLAEAVREAEFDLVVIDTLARSAVGVEENSATEMGQWIEQIGDSTVRAHDGTSVLYVHHTPKDGKGPRGSGSLFGAMDTVYELTGKNGAIRLERTKRKDGPQADVHSLKFEEGNHSGPRRA